MRAPLKTAMVSWAPSLNIITRSNRRLGECDMFVSRSRSRRLEVVGERENGRTQGRHARGEGVSFSLARFFLYPLLPNACYAG